LINLPIATFDEDPTKNNPIVVVGASLGIPATIAFVLPVIPPG
jgi:chemotaxis response regulator CheB